MSHAAPGARPAAFLDRDGTVIVDRDYPGDPAAVELLPGAARAIRRLNQAGMAVVMVTNQSGIGRGLISAAEFLAVQRRVTELLEAEGARVDAVYHCPHAPWESPPCQCRKPAPGMFRAAGADLGLDLAASIYVGDRLRDVLPGRELGGRAFLVGRTEPEGAEVTAPGTLRFPSLLDVVERVLEEPRD